MQDANTLTWTERKASAETVARVGWTAPILPEQAFVATLGPRSTSVGAYVSHGRWVVECPDCAGAQSACPDDRRFMCNNCANAVIGGFWRPVIWPKDRAAIDELLRFRPERNRNWQAGEALADLKAENKAFGVSPIGVVR